MSDVMQQLYDSEINAHITWFWDLGFDVSLGDGLNGYVDETRVDTWDEVETWLVKKAVEHFPYSDFAKAQAA